MLLTFSLSHLIYLQVCEPHNFTIRLRTTKWNKLSVHIITLILIGWLSVLVIFYIICMHVIGEGRSTNSLICIIWLVGMNKSILIHQHV